MALCDSSLVSTVDYYVMFIHIDTFLSNDPHWMKNNIYPVLNAGLESGEEV